MNVDELMARYATEWLGRQVDRVEGRGTDWYGDTENGFDEKFTLELKGPDLFQTLDGEELGAFWAYVMKQTVDTTAPEEG